MRSSWVRVQCGVAAILLFSFAFFWHSRDWNTASRLILTYAIVDEGTVCLDGLDRVYQAIDWPPLTRKMLPVANLAAGDTR